MRRPAVGPYARRAGRDRRAATPPGRYRRSRGPRGRGTGTVANWRRSRIRRHRPGWPGELARTGASV